MPADTVLWLTEDYRILNPSRTPRPGLGRTDWCSVVGVIGLEADLTPDELAWIRDFGRRCTAAHDQHDSQRLGTVLITFKKIPRSDGPAAWDRRRQTWVQGPMWSQSLPEALVVFELQVNHGHAMLDRWVAVGPDLHVGRVQGRNRDDDSKVWYEVAWENNERSPMAVYPDTIRAVADDRETLDRMIAAVREADAAEARRLARKAQV